MNLIRKLKSCYSVKYYYVSCKEDEIYIYYQINFCKIQLCNRLLAICRIFNSVNYWVVCTPKGLEWFTPDVIFDKSSSTWQVFDKFVKNYKLKNKKK